MGQVRDVVILRSSFWIRRKGSRTAESAWSRRCVAAARHDAAEGLVPGAGEKSKSLRAASFLASQTGACLAEIW